MAKVIPINKLKQDHEILACKECGAIWKKRTEKQPYQCPKCTYHNIGNGR